MNQIVPANQNVKQLSLFLDNKPVKDRLTAILPKNLTPERMIYQALTLANNNPALAECTHQSVYAGIIQAADLQLELSGPLGQAYLVPRRIKGHMTALFQVGYRGLQTLAYRSGKVSNFQLRMVKKGEPFDVTYGDYPHISHKPILFGADGEPVSEEVIAYYCVINYVDGGKDFEVMTMQQCLAHRERFASTKSGGPWYDMNHGFHEMSLKTTSRRICKRSPVSVQLVTAAMVDEYHEAGIVDHNLLPSDNTSRTNELAGLLNATPEEPRGGMGDSPERFSGEGGPAEPFMN